MRINLFGLKKEGVTGKKRREKGIYCLVGVSGDPPRLTIYLLPNGGKWRENKQSCEGGNGGCFPLSFLFLAFIQTRHLAIEYFPFISIFFLPIIWPNIVQEKSLYYDLASFILKIALFCRGCGIQR